MSDALTGKISEEAVKTISQLVAAILEPTAKRLGANARYRALKSRAQDRQLVDVLEDYQVRLQRRLSHVTTLVFPLQPLPLEKIYVPVNIIDSVRLTHEPAQSFGLHSLKKGNNFIIVDGAGIGKTTFVKYLALQILYKKEGFPIFFELRRIDEDESLIDRLVDELYHPSNLIDKEILQLLLEAGDFIIILDGYDELQRDMRRRIDSEIAELSLLSDRTTVILTTRPEVHLPTLYNVKALSIQSLTFKQVTEIIKRYDEFSETELLSDIVSELHKVPDELKNTPLLVSLLYRVYGYNHSLSNKITTFIGEMYQALYKGHDALKAGFERDHMSGLDIDDFRALLRSFAFVLTSRQKYSLENEDRAREIIDEARQFVGTQPTSTENFLRDLLVTVPLIHWDGLELRFAHRSIQESFAAEFLASSIFSPGILSEITLDELQDVYFETLHYFSELEPLKFQSIITKYIAQDSLNYSRGGNDFINTIAFLSTTYIGMWKKAEYTAVMVTEDNEGNEVEYEIFDLGNEQYFIYDYWEEVYEGEKYYVAVICREPNRRIYSSTWKDITLLHNIEHMRDDNKSGYIYEDDFEDLMYEDLMAPESISEQSSNSTEEIANTLVDVNLSMIINRWMPLHKVQTFINALPWNKHWIDLLARLFSHCVDNRGKYIDLSRSSEIRLINRDLAKKVLEHIEGIERHQKILSTMLENLKGGKKPY